jgi:hypothetical protein
MSNSALDKAGDKLQAAADKLGAQGGLKSKLAKPLAEDADFIRKLKPSLIVARAKGNAPTDETPGEAHVAPSGPQLGARPRGKKRRSGSGPSPWLVIGIGLAAGIVLAKVIDWRGHAHPRD